MPKISQAYKTETTSLPSYEGSEVVFKTGISVKDAMDAENVEGDMEKSMILLSKFIVSWNFSDDADQPLPVTIESIKQLPMSDIEQLLSVLTPYIQKKTESEKM